MTITEQIEAVRLTMGGLLRPASSPKTRALARAVGALADIAAEQERRLRVLEPCPVDPSGHHRWSDGADTECLRCRIKVTT